MAGFIFFLRGLFFRKYIPQWGKLSSLPIKIYVRHATALPQLPKTIDPVLGRPFFALLRVWLKKARPADSGF
jgi:hypothetical protein